MDRSTKQSEHAKAGEVKGEQLASPPNDLTFVGRVTASVSGLTRDVFGPSFEADHKDIMHSLYRGKSRNSNYADSSSWRDHAPHIRKSRVQPGKGVRSTRSDQSHANKIGSSAGYVAEDAVALDVCGHLIDPQQALSASLPASNSRQPFAERALPTRPMSIRNHKGSAHSDSGATNDNELLAVSLSSSRKAPFDTKSSSSLEYCLQDDLAKPFRSTPSHKQQRLAQHESWVADWHDVLDSHAHRTLDHTQPVIITRPNQISSLQSGNDNFDARVADRLRMIHSHLVASRALTLEASYMPFIDRTNPTTGDYHLEMPLLHCPWRSCHEVRDPISCSIPLLSLLTAK